jgi:hypothetical protein
VAAADNRYRERRRQYNVTALVPQRSNGRTNICKLLATNVIGEQHSIS